MPHGSGASPPPARATLRRRALTAVVVLIALASAGCGSSANPVLDDPEAVDAAGVVRLRPEVIAVSGHDPDAYTQGFEIAGDTLWESTGRKGRSQLRALDPATGAVRRTVDLPPEVFGEGVTVLPDRIWQLTWTDGVVYDRDPRTGALRRTLPLDREGWGICHGPAGLVTSDGTDELVFRDPVSFAPARSVRVTVAGRPVSMLNELECPARGTGADGIWANVYQSDHLVLIDPTDGHVTAVVDAAGLLPAAQRAAADVLNGIAAVPGTDEYLLTGKLWPTTFRVRFVPAR